MIYVSFECLKYKFLLFLLCFLCYAENNKIRTFWVWKLSKNKNIEPHQNTTISYKKRFIVITKFMSSTYIWGVITLLLISLIFLEIIKKKYDSSSEVLSTHICHQTFSLYIIGIPFSSLLFFSFSLFFLFFCLFSLNLWLKRQLLPLFYISISGLVESTSEHWN